MAKDLVCGTSVKEESPPATSQVGSAVYYFCSTGCKMAFDHNPARYLVAQAAEPATSGAIPGERARDNQSALIRAVGLTKAYLRGRDRVPALQGVSLDIYQGEMAGRCSSMGRTSVGCAIRN